MPRNVAKFAMENWALLIGTMIGGNVSCGKLSIFSVCRNEYVILY